VFEEKATAKLSSYREHRRLLNYLKDLNIPDHQQKYQSNKKFYYHLANVFARLRLYPLAMKCFLKTVQFDDLLADSTQTETAAISSSDSTQAAYSYLNVSSTDDSVVYKKALLLKTAPTDKRSKRISYQRIIDNFNDGKQAVAYALLFHVKQPAPGKRKIFVWANTGHTFITLIKYNADSTYASASFGFYPKKDQLLSATPVFPTTSATFKDDAGHKWDEVLGKFITRRKFEKILALTKDFNQTKYNLNNNNCTDFGLQAAALAGININDTVGKWPLGKGNTPALTGQSILSGKVINDDHGKLTEVFTDNTVNK
jgi:hypothetical protein